MVKSVEGNITPLGVRHDMVEAIWEKTKPTTRNIDNKIKRLYYKGGAITIRA